MVTPEEGTAESCWSFEGHLFNKHMVMGVDLHKMVQGNI